MPWMMIVHTVAHLVDWVFHDEYSFPVGQTLSLTLSACSCPILRLSALGTCNGDGHMVRAASFSSFRTSSMDSECGIYLDTAHSKPHLKSVDWFTSKTTSKLITESPGELQALRKGF